MNTELLQLGAVAIIFGFAIKEFFAYLKIKKNDSKSDERSDDDKDQNESISRNSTNIAVIMQRLSTIESNHLVHIQKDLEKNSGDHDSMKAQLIGLSTKMDHVIEHISSNKLK